LGGFCPLGSLFGDFLEAPQRAVNLVFFFGDHNAGHELEIELELIQT
jgi:hypothetical protein